MQALLPITFCLVIICGNMFTHVCHAQSQVAQGAGSGAQVNIEEFSQRPFEPLNVYMDADRLKKDIESYKKALAHYNEEKSPREYGILLIRIGFSYLAVQTAERGQDVYEAAKQFSTAIKVCGEKGLAKEYHEAKIGMGLALIEFTEGDHVKNLHEAIKMLDEGAKFFKKESDPLAYIIANNGLGSAYAYLYGATGYKKEDLSAAEGYFDEVLSIANHKQFPVQYAKAQIGLGTVYLDSFGAGGDKLMMEKALLALSEARNVFSETFFPTLYTKAYFLTALAYVNDKDYKKAREFMEKTMMIADRTKDPLFEAYMNFYYSIEASRGLLE